MDRMRVVAGALCLSLLAGTAQSASVFAFEETGGNVVGTLSGSLNLTGAKSYLLEGEEGDEGGIIPALAVVASGFDVRGYLIFGPKSFGTNDSAVYGPASGSSFFLAGFYDLVGVPMDYQSGESLSATLNFVDTTFSGLGITPGEYVYTLPNDTVTVRFGPPAAIPLPATLPLLLGGLALAFAAARRRA